LKINKFLLVFFLFFFCLNSQANQIFGDNPTSRKKQNNANFVSQIGDENKDSKWKNIFQDKAYLDIKEFIEALPSKSPNAVVQKMILNFLTTKKTFNGELVSLDEDKKILEILINKLFETGRINEIEYYYSQSTNLRSNEFILVKMIEGNFLRNRHEEACKILQNKATETPPEIFGKVIVICDILNNKYEQAKLGLLLLKEQNKPGDSFFIDLAYSLMSEENISGSKNIKKKLEEIKSLNPIIMSSLQFADISPNYDQVEKLNTSGLLFILSNPAVDTDIKIFCSELLVKQGRVENDFLAEAYMLPRYDNADLENSLKLYKTLSPSKARPLLYQSVVMEKNNEVKFQKIIALLKVSIIDNLFSQISNLVLNFVDTEYITESKEQILLISRMYQSQKDYIQANMTLNKIESEDDIDLIFRELSIEISKHLDGIPVNDFIVEERIKNLSKIKDLNSQKYQKIITNLILNYQLNQNMYNSISKFNFFSNEKLNNNSLNNLFLAESFSKKNDLFNSMKIFFKTIGNKSLENLSLIDTYKILVILKNLGFNDELKEIAINLIE
tara:strand:+ start:7682 stop:9355 length:1674 start_codon:yes stop_codon:yes gene_type:complete